MRRHSLHLVGAAILGAVAVAIGSGHAMRAPAAAPTATAVRVNGAAAHDVSPPLSEAPFPAAQSAVEQTAQGTRPAAVLLESFDGHGYGTVGPHGPGAGNNPSDNSLAVGRNHIVETVNSRLAVYTKKGEIFDESGVVLFGPIGTNVLFSGFGGECEARPNGDAVVRYDQLADRWLYVMPLFRRAAQPTRPGEEPPYGMCYAVSATENPLGPYHRYYFERPLFPDYPRPAIWSDGYYVPTSTGDNLLPDGSLPEKHACVVERSKMLEGLPAREQCVIIEDANFLNNADIDGRTLPPAGAPNIMMATGGTQLRDDFDDDGIYVWKFHVDWDLPENTRVTGPVKVDVAPYHYLCDGQLTSCVPQPGTDQRLDAQGDKIMQRLIYRNIGGRESIVAVHSVATAAGGGGVRWYEFRLDANRDVVLHQQGTYAPDSLYRWMASAGMDRQGNIGIGYSFGGTPHYAGQRFAGRLADDPSGQLTFRETVLVEGQAAQTNTLRWEDYTQLAIDPTDDCTFWYVGDYLKRGAPSYTTRIGAFRLPGCLRGVISGAVFYDVNRNGLREPNEPGLGGWFVAAMGGPRPEDARMPPPDTVRTGVSGEFTLSLPADPAYRDPNYTVSSPASTHAAWTRIDSGAAYWSGGALPMVDGVYRFQLRDRDAVARLDFGNVCVIANSGAAGPTYWSDDAGRAVLRANDAQPVEPGARGGRGGRGRGGALTPGAGGIGWRALLNTTTYLVAGSGSRFQVPAGPFDEAYGAFRAWLTAAAGSAEPTHRASAHVAALALSIAYGEQDASSTVHDPVDDDWPSVAALLGRVGTLLQTDPAPAAGSRERAAAESYARLLTSLSRNAETVTPSEPARCPPPF